VVDAQSTAADARNAVDDGLAGTASRWGQLQTLDGSVIAMQGLSIRRTPRRPGRRRALSAAALTMTSCGKKDAAEAEAPAPVQVTAVTQATIHRVVSGTGSVPDRPASVMPKFPRRCRSST